MYRIGCSRCLFGSDINGRKRDMKIITIILFLMTFSFGIGQTKFMLKCDSELLDSSLDSALAQVGIIELTNKNDGEVEKYLRLFSLKSGQPYCAAGQYWCFFVSAKKLGLSLSEIPITKSPLAYNIFKDAKKRGIRGNYHAAKNDMIVWRKKDSRNGHIERVYSVSRKGNVTTIGFNTKDKKSNRQGVFFQRRNIYHPLERLMIKGLIGFK